MPQNSFDDLVNKYASQVLNTALRILGDTQRAQDVHQEVFLQIWRRWHKYNSSTNWNAYLYRTTVRKALQLAKRPKTGELADQHLQHLAAGQRPDAQLKVAELQQKLAGCLGKLPKRQTDVFVLSRIEGLKHDKIAELLGCSQKTVRVHLHRAIKRLARELGDYSAQ